MLINPLVFSLRQNGYCGNYVLFVSPCFTICEAGTSLDWDDDPKGGIFLKLQIQTLFFVGYPVVLALGVIKKACSASLVWICLMSKLVYPAVYSAWQDVWNDVVANKLHHVKLLLGNCQTSCFVLFLYILLLCWNM